LALKGDLFGKRVQKPEYCLSSQCRRLGKDRILYGGSCCPILKGKGPPWKGTKVERENTGVQSGII